MQEKMINLSTLAVTAVMIVAFLRLYLFY